MGRKATFEGLERQEKLILNKLDRIRRQRELILERESTERGSTDEDSSSRFQDVQQAGSS